MFDIIMINMHDNKQTNKQGTNLFMASLLTRHVSHGHAIDNHDINEPPFMSHGLLHIVQKARI